MGIEFIDSHVHLDAPKFEDDLGEVLSRAKAEHVVYLLNPGESLESSRKSVELSKKYDEIYAAVGIHPHNAKDDNEDVYSAIKELAVNKKVVAVGEIGLDYFHNLSPAELQRETFRKYIRLARELNLPVIIHCRDAFEDIERILREESSERYRGVVHSFSADKEWAQRFMQMGFYISFTGQITYPRSDGLRATVGFVPVEKMLLETDAPFLPPQAERGRRNEPSFIRFNAEKLAEIKELSVEDIGRVTWRNATKLFGIGRKTQGDVIAYKIKNSLYLNITNDCTNKCVFCRRLRDPVVKGHNLRLSREPTYEEIVLSIGDPKKYDEVVFCGYGEPLLRLEIVKRVAQYLRDKGCKHIRIDTNGEANLVYKRNIVPELVGFTDSFSVSLNASNKGEYDRLCRSEFGKDAYDEVKKFIVECKKYFADVTATIVGVPGIDVEKCRRIVEEELRVKFRLRVYNEVG